MIFSLYYGYKYRIFGYIMAMNIEPKIKEG